MGGRGFAAVFALLFIVPLAQASDPPQGAFTSPDGEIVVVNPYLGDLYFFTQDGRTGSLAEAQPGVFVGTEPALPKGEITHSLRAEGSGYVLELDDKDLPLSAVPLEKSDYTFDSGGLALKGRLVAPADEDFGAVVILVHGSDSTSAVDNNYFPYFFAANGLATFVYDKRGTGGSDGRYTQDIEVLSDDVVAAIEFVADMPELAGKPILLAGFSQGGWVAPLASVKSGRTAGVLVAYGPAVSIREEDRWGYAYWMQEEGYSSEDLAKADQLFDLLTDMRTRGRPDRWDELKPLVAQYKHETWYQQALPGVDSTLASLADSPVPLTLRYWWASLFGLDLFVDYDPAQALAELEVPSLWLFAAEDSSMPSAASVANLQQLATQGAPIEYRVYPETEHGIYLFEAGQGRQRNFIAYHPDYYDDMIGWLKAMAASH
jgi:pimeloyl-ACP methyl ester carboxylesterase